MQILFKSSNIIISFLFTSIYLVMFTTAANAGSFPNKPWPYQSHEVKVQSSFIPAPVRSHLSLMENPIEK